MITCPRTPGCTGCPTCDDDARFVMSINLSNPDDCKRYADWLIARDAKRAMRTAGARFELRTNITYQEDTMPVTDTELALIIKETTRLYELKHGRPRAASLRTAVDAPPPDPYKDGILRLQQADAQAAAARTHTPAPRPTEMHLDANGVPDPYFHDLARLKGAR